MIAQSVAISALQTPQIRHEGHGEGLEVRVRINKMQISYYVLERNYRCHLQRYTNAGETSGY